MYKKCSSRIKTKNIFPAKNDDIHEIEDIMMDYANENCIFIKTRMLSVKSSTHNLLI